MFGFDREWQQTQNLFAPSQFRREKYEYDLNDDWNFHWDDEDLMLEFERDYVECILPDEEVADFHLAVGEDSVDEYFTPRCVLELTLQKQREAISAQLLMDEDWAGLALMLSPIPPAKKVCQGTEPSPPCNVCLCPACAGADAKPMVSTCAVCSAQILYSICTKHQPVAESQQPSMCCVCMRVLTL